MNAELIRLLGTAYMWDRIDSNHVYATFLGYKTHEYIDFQSKCVGSIGTVVNVEYDNISCLTYVTVREE